MATLLWLAALAALLAWLTSRRIGKAAPLALGLWFLAGVFALATISGLGLVGVGDRTAAIVAVGIVGLATPALLVSRRRRLITAAQARTAELKRPPWPRIAVSAVILTGLVLVGYLAFRSRISTAAGVSFGNLTAQQIRAAQNGAARGGGFAALCSAATPVLACLGVYAARVYSRSWYLATALAFAVMLESPARTSVLALGVTTLVFFFYLRNQRMPQRTKALESQRTLRTRKPRSLKNQRARRALLVVVALAAALYYFQSVGNATHKTDQIAATYPGFWGPAWLVSPILYFTGGLSALSQSLNQNFDPFDHPNSIYVLAKIGHVLDPAVHVPNTVANYVGIPAPFNVYTGFGQLYWDFGFVGVFGFCVLLGYVALIAHRRALAGRMEWAFVSAVVANVLASMQLEYRLFLLDLDFQLLLGVATFWFIEREAKKRATQPPALTVDRPEPQATATPVPAAELSPGWSQALGIRTSDREHQRITRR